VAPSPVNAERVARALTNYLAGSGEYAYTLDLRRQDRSLDPVLDFLSNVKAGHCDLYSSALVLLLRSRGIPARIVKGFRGADDTGDGMFVIRQSHAHTWVEALVPRDKGRSPGYDWLTLDPTPGGEVTFSEAGWTWPSPGEMWRDLIVEYNAERQADLWRRLLGGPVGLARLFGWLAVAAGLAGLLSAAALWTRRRRRARALRRPVTAATASAVACFARLLELLARHVRLRPRADRTPREFAEEAAALLRLRPAMATLAEVPGHVVEFYYRVRFGGQLPNAAEVDAVTQELERLQSALEQTPRSEFDEGKKKIEVVSEEEG
jgi:hypothetical protein